MNRDIKNGNTGNIKNEWQEETMAVNFNESETKDNLMTAFAGESQARNRYTFAASFAGKTNLHVVKEVFLFTAEQEKAHAKVFYQHLKEMAGQTIHVDGTYPVDLDDNVVALLRRAQHNEYEEHEDVYQKFAQKAREEGFLKVANSFEMIAEIEKVHGDRFGKLADLLEHNKLFVADVVMKWMCLNCGHIHEGENAPEICPVCQHDKGFFISLTLAPFSES